MLTQQDVEVFNRDGFLDGGPCLTDDEVNELRAELERVITDQGSRDVPQPALLRDLAGEGNPVWQIVNIWMASPPYRRLLEHPKITADIAQLTGADELRIWHDQIQYRPAEVGGQHVAPRCAVVAGAHADERGHRLGGARRRGLEEPPSVTAQIDEALEAAGPDDSVEDAATVGRRPLFSAAGEW